MPPATEAEALAQAIAADLPISRHLGIRVEAADRSAVVLTAPLAENRNHKGTAFGGSLSAIATLAAWAWCWLLCRELGIAAQVVVQDSTIVYARPLAVDIRARCAAPAPQAVQRFLAAYRRSGRGRLTLAVEIGDAAGVAVRFTGRFVAEAVAGARA